MKKTYIHAAAILLLQAGMSTACADQPKATESSSPALSSSEPAVQSAPVPQFIKANTMTPTDRIAALQQSMLAYKEATGTDYTKKEVEECSGILTSYLEEIAGTQTKAEGMLVVKSAVTKLNELNNRAGGDMIETDEREAIAAIIIGAGHAKGYNGPEEDITEAWREW